MSNTVDVLSAGEVMVEFHRHKQSWQQSFGGDTYNTAVYLSRAGLRSGYMTCIGDDRFSVEMVSICERENIVTDWIFFRPRSAIGFYYIYTDVHGRSSFKYWRSKSPARQLFVQPSALPPCRCFYFSGITLAVIYANGFDNFLTFLANMKRQCITVFFDPNLRAKLWQSLADARHSILRVLPYCDVIFTNAEDDLCLWGLSKPTESWQFYTRFSTMSELVIRDRNFSSHGFRQSSRSGVDDHYRPLNAQGITDSTGSTDAFNAADISAKLKGRALDVCVAEAQALASQVAQTPGAIVPPSKH